MIPLVVSATFGYYPEELPLVTGSNESASIWESVSIQLLPATSPSPYASLPMPLKNEVTAQSTKQDFIDAAIELTDLQAQQISESHQQIQVLMVLLIGTAALLVL